MNNLQFKDCTVVSTLCQRFSVTTLDMLKALLSMSRGNKPPQDQSVATPDLSRIFPELRDSEADSAAQRCVASAKNNGLDLDNPPVSAASPNDPDDAPTADDMLAWLDRDIQGLREAYARFAQDLSITAKRDLFLGAHNLKGTAASFGRPAVGRIATSLCKLLEGDGSAADSLALVQLHIDAIRAATLTDSEASDDLADAVCVALEDQVNARLA